MSKRTVAEFVNKLFELRSKGHVLLYKGPISNGGYTEVSINARKAEGYSQVFYDIKQVIAEPNKTASVQNVNIPNEALVYELIKESIEDEPTRVHKRKSRKNTEGDAESEEYCSDDDVTSGSSNSEQPIEVVRVDSGSSKNDSKSNNGQNSKNEQTTKGLYGAKSSQSSDTTGLSSSGVASAISALNSIY